MPGKSSRPSRRCAITFARSSSFTVRERQPERFKSPRVAGSGVFVAVFVALNLMLSWLIVGPVSRMSEAADKISTGDFDQPEFPEEGKDEVAVLANAFNRMRRSLEKAMQMIDS